MYSIGVDPTWYRSSNELTFVNSMKMKISVIFGVAQMSLGILMKAFNAVHFGRPIDFIFEFIPQLTLLTCLFGWMDFLIIAKWVQFWPNGAARAPNIISVMINMFLNFGAVDKDNVDPIIAGDSGQQAISIILLVVALLCVPTMLLGTYSNIIIIITIYDVISLMYSQAIIHQIHNNSSPSTSPCWKRIWKVPKT